MCHRGIEGAALLAFVFIWGVVGWALPPAQASRIVRLAADAAPLALSLNASAIYVGVALGIVALRFVSGMFLKLLERFPALDHTAYALVAWAGLKLGLEAAESFGASVLHRHWPVALPEWGFWAGMGVLVLAGGAYALRHPAASKTI